MNNKPDTSSTACPICRAEAARRRLVQNQRALTHLKRLSREGEAMLEAEHLDNARHGLWCQRVERYVCKLFATSHDYSHAFRVHLSGVRSPLDMLNDEPVAPPPKPLGADVITKQWLIPLVSAIERQELHLNQKPLTEQPDSKP